MIAKVVRVGLQLQSGNSCFFGGRPSWTATELQLQFGNSRFFGGSPSWKATGLQLQQLEGPI